MAILCYERIRYTLLIFSIKRKNELILISGTQNPEQIRRERLPSYFYSYKVKTKNNNLLEVEGHVPHSLRR